MRHAPRLPPRRRLPLCSERGHGVGVFPKRDRGGGTNMISSSIARRGRRIGLVALAMDSAAAVKPARDPHQPPATLFFTIEQTDQPTVYVAAPGAALRRIGPVIPGRTETLTIP